MGNTDNYVDEFSLMLNNLQDAEKKKVILTFKKKYNNRTICRKDHQELSCNQRVAQKEFLQLSYPLI